MGITFRIDSLYLDTSCHIELRLLERTEAGAKAYTHLSLLVFHAARHR